MPPLTKRSIFWHTVRIYLWTKAVQFIKMKMKKSKWATLLALLGGSVLYKFAVRLVDFIFCKVYDL